MSLDLFLLILSPFVGSFLGLLVYRIPRRMDIVWRRSFCDHCGSQLPTYALLPIVPFVFQKGRSFCCRHPISLVYPIIESFSFLVVVICLLSTDLPHAYFGIALGWGLLCLSFIDIQHFRLPDCLTAPLLTIGLLLTQWNDPAAFKLHVAAVVLGWGILMLIMIGYRLMRDIDGLGEGDAKLMAVGGAWLGPLAIGPILLISCAIALFWVLILKLRGSDVSLTLKLPYGVFLSIAIFGIWLWQPWILR